MTRIQPHVIAPTRNSARIALVYKNNAPKAVSHIGLGVTALCTMRTLRANGIHADVWPVGSVQALTAQLDTAQAAAHAHGEHPVTHVVIAALWMATTDLAALAMRFPNVHFTVVSHSNVGFLQADPGAVRLLREALDLSIAHHNVSVAGNCRRFVQAWTSMYGRSLVWLPNLYDLTTIRDVGERLPWNRGSTLRLGVFGATRVLKNMITAVAACIELGSELRTDVEIYMNAGRNEDAGTTRSAIDQLVAGLPHCKVVPIGWQTWPEFRSQVRVMNLLLQPSYTESFNMVTADGVAEGVASVVSDAIDWVPSDWIAPADDVQQVARVARRLLVDTHAVNDGQALLRRYVTDGMQQWEHYIMMDGHS